MTTIAYRDGLMACDSACTDGGGGFIPGNYDKIYRLPKGPLIGIAGDADERAFHELMSRVELPSDIPSVEELKEVGQTHESMIVFQPGEIWTVGCNGGDTPRGQTMRINWPFFSIGNGDTFALAAMMQGGTAVEAIRIACKLDMGSNLPVKTRKL